MEEIARWLKNPYDYQEGVDLYKSYGSNNSLIFMFETGESEFNKKKLISSLMKLNDDVVDIPHIHEPHQQITRKEVTEPHIVNVPYTGIKQIDDRFNTQLKGYYQQQSALHVKLKLLYALGKPQNELQPLCFEILRIGTKIRSLLLLQEEHRSTGEMPAAMKTVRELSPDKQLRKLMTNRSYISKFCDDENKRDEVERRLMENYELDEILNTDE